MLITVWLEALNGGSQRGALPTSTQCINNEQIKNLFATCPQLKQVEEHSKNLSIIASMGLEALDKLKSGAKDARWTNEKLTVLENANQVHGETELSITLT